VNDNAPPPPPRPAPTIKDQAEYNAYVSAIQQQSPQAKASALEGFLNTYPNSVVKQDALEVLMATYQQLNNAQNLQQTAQKLLQVDPNNVRALALLTYLTRSQLESGQVQPAQAQSVAQQLVEYAQKGLQSVPQMPKGDGQSDAQYMQARQQLKQLFIGALGFAELQLKNYPEAQTCLHLAADSDPTLANVYPLAISLLEAKPMNPIGLWYAAKAVALAQGSQAQQQIAQYGHARYVRYHGGEDGWQQLIQQAASSNAPPPNFTVAPAPSPQEVACNLVKTKPVAQMSFDEIQLVLTSGAQQCADQVWNDLKGKPIALEGKLVQGTADRLQIAGTYDDINANPPKADIDLTLAAPLPARLQPKNGATVDFQGTPETYEPNPFMMHMDKGCLVNLKTSRCISLEAPTPKRRTTTTRRRRPSSR
jgi:tetratricopeptide (TPR) repeat protein